MRFSDWSSYVCSSDLFVPGVSLFEQLRPFLLQHRAELIAEHREESGEIEFGMDIGVLHVETAGDALPHRLDGEVHHVAFPMPLGDRAAGDEVGDLPQDRKSTRLNSSH